VLTSSPLGVALAKWALAVLQAFLMLFLNSVVPIITPSTECSGSEYLASLMIPQARQIERKNYRGNH